LPAACDYLVIGSGAADAVVAARLSDDPDIQVVLLEAGGRDNSLLLKLPGLGFAVGTHPRYYNWGHETAPVPGLMGRPELRICEAFSAAAAGMGFPILDDLNRDTVDGFGYYDINVGDGRRLSTATAFLRPNDSRSNLTVVTGALATRLINKGGRAVGADILQGAGLGKSR